MDSVLSVHYYLFIYIYLLVKSGGDVRDLVVINDVHLWCVLNRAINFICSKFLHMMWKNIIKFSIHSLANWLSRNNGSGNISIWKIVPNIACEVWSWCWHSIWYTFRFILLHVWYNSDCLKDWIKIGDKLGILVRW